MPRPEVITLANAFRAKLRQWLTPAQIAQVDATNAERNDDSRRCYACPADLPAGSASNYCPACEEEEETHCSPTCLGVDGGCDECNAEYEVVECDPNDGDDEGRIVATFGDEDAAKMHARTLPKHVAWEVWERDANGTRTRMVLDSPAPTWLVEGN